MSSGSPRFHNCFILKVVCVCIAAGVMSVSLAAQTQNDTARILSLETHGMALKQTMMSVRLNC